MAKATKKELLAAAEAAGVEAHADWTNAQIVEAIEEQKPDAVVVGVSTNASTATAVDLAPSAEEQRGELEGVAVDEGVHGIHQPLGDPLLPPDVGSEDSGESPEVARGPLDATP